MDKVLYTSVEYNKMERLYKKQLKKANEKIAKLEKQVKQLKTDYAVLLETSTEEIIYEDSRSEESITELSESED